MTTLKQILTYLDSLPGPKSSEMKALHSLMLKWLPETKLCFESGKDANGKTVSNPVIGYGSYKHQFANGKIDDMFKLGISANTAGISLYCMGLNDKNYLNANYASSIGKAKITGYCIKFKKLSDLNIEVLELLVKDLLKI
ncbi:MAG: DUF1801 domain-containing protein [Chitinophagaceae bacterium]